MGSDSDKFHRKEIEAQRVAVRASTVGSDTRVDLVYQSLITPMRNILSGVAVSENIETLSSMPVLLGFRLLEDHTDSIDYPIMDFFHFLQVQNNVKAQWKCMCIFAFLVSTKFFPFDEFVAKGNGENVQYLMNLIQQTSNRRVFGQSVLAMKYLLKRSLELRNMVIDAGFLEILDNSVCFKCSKVASFLKAMVEMGGLSCEYSQMFLILLRKLIKMEDPQALKNVLDAIREIVKQTQEVVDLRFIYENLDVLIENENIFVLSSLICLLKYLPNISRNYADVFLKKLLTYRELIGPIMSLYRAKVGEWDGFINDELIEVMFNFLDFGVCYQNELEIFQTLLLYFPFDSVFDIRMIKEVLRFIKTPSLTQQCVKSILKLMSSDLTSEQKMDLCEMLDDELTDFDLFLMDCDPETKVIGDIFFQEYAKMKEEIK